MLFYLLQPDYLFIKQILLQGFIIIKMFLPVGS